jgi:hypothetical protein
MHHASSDPTPLPAPMIDVVVLTGLAASSGQDPTAGEAAASAMSHIDHELASAGLVWGDLRMLTLQIEADIPGVASWRLLAGRRRD